MRNTGKSSEDDFEGILTRKGKNAYFNRLVDAAEVYGRVGKRGYTKAQPCDYLIVMNGQTIFAEVKSTVDAVSLKPGLLKVGQHAHAKQIVAAKGTYKIYVKSLIHQQWYVFDYCDFPMKATKWEDLGAFKWNT